jgi:uncharacterized protein YjiS (DUF1127 family)
MAAFETTRPVMGSTLGGRLSNLVSFIIAAYSDWNDARVTRNALAKLSDRELDDIGLCRGDIEMIASNNR